VYVWGGCYSTPDIRDKLGIIWKTSKVRLDEQLSWENMWRRHIVDCLWLLPAFDEQQWSIICRLLLKTGQCFDSFINKSFSWWKQTCIPGRKENEKRQIFWFVCDELPLCSVHVYSTVCTAVRLNCLELWYIPH
jgi:hypothetical protein